MTAASAASLSFAAKIAASCRALSAVTIAFKQELMRGVSEKSYMKTVEEVLQERLKKHQKEDFAGY